MRFALFISAASLLFACAGSTDVASQQSSLDGTWDITAAGPDPIAASSMTISANTIVGNIGIDDAGYLGVDGKPCAAHTEQKFQIEVNGDSATGLFTASTTYTPASCDDPYNSSSTIKATRTAGTAPTDGTTFDGQWLINDADDRPFAAVTVMNLVVQAWDNAQDRDANKAPTLSSNIVNNSTTTQTDNKDLSFAARRRN